MKRLLVGAMLGASATLSAQTQQGKVAYPTAKTVVHADDYFGRKVSDPYRWMEDLNAPGFGGVGQGRERGHGTLSRHAPHARSIQVANHGALQSIRSHRAVS